MTRQSKLAALSVWAETAGRPVLYIEGFGQGGRQSYDLHDRARLRPEWPGWDWLGVVSEAGSRWTIATLPLEGDPARWPPGVSIWAIDEEAQPR